MGELTKKNDSNIQMALLKIVERTDIDPDRLEKFLNLQIKIEDRQAKASFYRALSGFQSDCPIIPKTRKVNFDSKGGNKVKYNYSPLDEIVHIVKPHLKTWGLSYTFNIIKTDNQKEHTLITKIYHCEGHAEEFSYFFNPLHDDARMNQSQRAKSANTYAKRAGLENSLGIVTAEEDDDARRAIDRPITDEQLVSIKSLIGKTKTQEKKLFDFLKIEKLSDLSEFEAKRAIHALKQKRSG